MCELVSMWLFSVYLLLAAGVALYSWIGITY